MRTHLDLFSGIGGFALAAQWNGIKTVGFCEIEPYAKRVLAKNFPHVPIHEDVRNLEDFRKYVGTVDLITGGYPCQPFSVAGKQRGAEDDRHLWPAMLEIVKLIRPSWVLAENVAGHVKLGLDQVLSDLEAEGYTTRPLILPACAIGAPHRRDRVWIVAHASSERWERRGDNREERHLHEDQQWKSAEDKPAGEQWLDRASATHEDCVSADSSSERSQEPWVFGGQMCSTQNGNREINRAQHADQFQVPWMEAATELCRVDDGVSEKLDSHRLKHLGNAIVPQVAAEIIHAMQQTEKLKFI